ncbi:aspartyl-phosphate phosphatase Spo0E family protein [Herbivorax sp. ANBcel31]|nr:aspartyl-phosphate phosphatase Spo0E family protein [Herbivorax sp. ANBcel31]MDQ2087403.1 aspartyl-phosphate phosphatase Spo0E family protein [Herbivorax sp. ANBcel31]
MDNIESLRENLYEVLDSGDDSEILTASQELDKLIANYMLQQLKLSKYAS